MSYLSLTYIYISNQDYLQSNLIKGFKQALIHKSEYILWDALLQIFNSQSEVQSVIIIVVINVEFSQINELIDQLPLFAIQKLKQKFNSYTNSNSEIPVDQFIMMHLSSEPIRKLQYNAQRTQQEKTTLKRLYQYYTDNQAVKLKFKNFIRKYAILSKCKKQTLQDIIYFLFCNHNTASIDPVMTNQDFNKFIEKQKKYFGFKVEPIQNILGNVTKQQLVKRSNESGFIAQDFRRKYSLIDKEDFPFEAISRGLIQMDINDFTAGQQYCIISTAWFDRWAYYYQGLNDFLQPESLKSTKLFVKQKMKRKGSVRRNSLIRQSSRFIQLDDDNTWLIQKPVSITFQDIEGQYSGQLKENIRTNYQIKVLSLQLWKQLKKTMPAHYQFKRIALSDSTLQLYPKSIYFLTAFNNGTIDDTSFKILHCSLKKKLKDVLDQGEALKNIENGKPISFFIKDFGEDYWNEIDESKVLAMCSAQSRFFVVATNNRKNFLQKNTRRQVLVQDVTYGDKVFAYFSFTKNLVPGYVMRRPGQKKVKVHFIGYNFRYEIEVAIDQIAFEQKKQLVDSLRMSTDIQAFEYKGIRNIGNTCFINSIIQCLISTPVFDSYMINNKFDNKKQPLIYQISQLCKLLTANKYASPNQLKKTIDVQLQIFSGNDQHDAQQFLSLLLDKFKEQLKKKPTIVEQLFGGTTISSLICQSCQNVNQKQEHVNIISLPIPEPEFNTFTVFTFPIYSNKIRKIMFRIHHTGTLSEYLSNFEDRMGGSSDNYIFVEVHLGVIKRIRKDLLDDNLKSKKLIDLGITPTIDIYAYQRIESRSFNQVKSQNIANHRQSDKKQIFKQLQQKWLFAKYVNKAKSKLSFQVMQQQQSSSISLVKLKKVNQQNMAALGTKTQQTVYSKLFMRKYNKTLDRMENFGFHIMINYPKEVNYQQLCYLVKIALKNFRDRPSKIKQPYYVRIMQRNKQKCLFCGKGDYKNEHKNEVHRCCNPTDTAKEVPLFWLAQDKGYTIYIQWLDFQQYNIQFSSMLEVDPLSSAVQRQKQQQKINVEECFKMLQEPQIVQMQCDKCKKTKQKRSQILGKVPNILVLHMQEYRMNANNMLMKMDVNLKWIQYLDVTKYSKNAKGCIYELFGYVCHTGTNNSGHYTATTRRKHLFEDKKIWVKFDDDLTQIKEKEQKNIDSAYLLFFKKVDIPNSAYLNFTNFEGVGA